MNLLGGDMHSHKHFLVFFCWHNFIFATSVGGASSSIVFVHVC